MTPTIVIKLSWTTILRYLLLLVCMHMVLLTFYCILELIHSQIQKKSELLPVFPFYQTPYVKCTYINWSCIWHYCYSISRLMHIMSHVLHYINVLHFFPSVFVKCMEPISWLLLLSNFYMCTTYMNALEDKPCWCVPNLTC